MNIHVFFLPVAICFGSMLWSAYGYSAYQQKTDRQTILVEPSDIVLEYKGRSYRAGDTIYGYKNYVKLVVGTARVPLLLGVPHDGILAGIPEIPETGHTGRDIHTLPLTTAIAELFRKDTGLQPWILINDIHRKRVDPNTYPKDVEARYGTATDGRKTYESYHELLLLARSTMAGYLDPHRGGLFIDMHGHAHQYAEERQEDYTSIVNGKSVPSRFIDQSELGYGLSGLSFEQEGLDTLAAWSSIYALAQSHPLVPFTDILRGPHSLGSLLYIEGIVSVPSVAIPFLEKDAQRFGLDTSGAKRRPYFNGGFVTRKYGSAQRGDIKGLPGAISAIQIEVPGITVRNNTAIIARSSHKFKRAIIAYLNKWYGYDFPNSKYPYAYF